MYLLLFRLLGCSDNRGLTHVSMTRVILKAYCCTRTKRQTARVTFAEPHIELINALSPYSCPVYSYLYINLAILIFPLVIAFEKTRIRYYSKIKSVAFSMFSVGLLFVSWDVLATSRGHWSFNPAYLLGIKFLGLPLEEILFFITTPFSCLFTYEALAYFLKDRKALLLDKLLPPVGIALALLSFLFLNKEYTFLALLSVGLTILAAPKLVPHLFSSRLYWSYIAVTFALFFAFNFLLTSLPIVEYSHLATTGLRLTTIPIEDFMFNFSMLTLYMVVHRWAAKKLNHTSI
jgi:lycopene cyclase domain-containing protein